MLLNSPKYKNEDFSQQLKQIGEKIDSFLAAKLKEPIEKLRFPSPNVYYEYGLAQMAQTRCLPILRRDQEKDFAFDVRNIATEFYDKKELNEKDDDNPEIPKFRKRMKDLIREYKETTKRAEEQE